MWFIRSLLLAALVATVGCGGGPAPESASPPSDAEHVRTMLESMVESGIAGSGVMDLQGRIGAMQDSDPEKANALQKGAEELMQMTDTEEIKAKAKEMLDSL